MLDAIAGFILWFAPCTDMDKPNTLANYIPGGTDFLELFVFLWVLFLLKKNQIMGLFARFGSSLDLIE